MKASFAILSWAVIVVSATRPQWGCGLLGGLPGISPDGSTTSEIQKMIDSLKATNYMGKVNYWNWNLAPMRNQDGTMQYLSKDFVFVPEQWGIQAVNSSAVAHAGTTHFLDAEGNPSPASMAELFLGANEPDIIGSCMGNMMGKCTGSCTAAEEQSGCPVANLTNPVPADPLPNGHCDCWSDSHSTGCGYWPLEGCSSVQPLPDLFTSGDTACVSAAMAQWRKQAGEISQKGFKYLSTPLIAVNMDWMEDFIEEACKDCTEMSCGCPTHVGWHFYAADCRPIELGGYKDFEHKLNTTKRLMLKFPFLQGAIVNEVGMLNCNQVGGGVCIPNGDDQKYPANKQPNNSCPSTSELPDGLGTFVEHLFDLAIQSGTTPDGRPVLASFSWFNEDMAGGTYNLRLFDNDGNINNVGEAYMKGCNRWANAFSNSSSRVA